MPRSSILDKKICIQNTSYLMNSKDIKEINYPYESEKEHRLIMPAGNVVDQHLSASINNHWGMKNTDGSFRLILAG